MEVKYMAKQKYRLSNVLCLNCDALLLSTI